MAAVVVTGTPNRLPPVASNVVEFVALATAIAWLGLITIRASSKFDVLLSAVAASAVDCP